MLSPNGPLTLTKKSKFSKGACPTQFFAYIPILESVSLFKTWKLCKLSNFQKVDFCTNPNQKSKFSRTCLAQFFAKIPILGSISSFENLKFLKQCDFIAIGFDVNFDKESRCPSKACPIQIFTQILILESAYLFWTWKPPMLRSTSSVQNLSSQDQDLRFIHLV